MPIYFCLKSFVAVNQSNILLCYLHLELELKSSIGHLFIFIHNEEKKTASRNF